MKFILAAVLLCIAVIHALPSQQQSCPECLKRMSCPVFPCQLVCELGSQKMCAACLNHHCPASLPVCRDFCFPSLPLDEKTDQQPSLEEDRAALRHAVNPCSICLGNNQCYDCLSICTEPIGTTCTKCVVDEGCNVCYSDCLPSSHDSTRGGAEPGTYQPPSDLPDRSRPRLGTCLTCVSDKQCHRCESLCSAPTWDCINCVHMTCPGCLNDCLPSYESERQLDLERELDTYQPPSDLPHRPRLENCLECVTDRQCCERLCSGPFHQTRQCLECVNVQCPECWNDCLPRQLDLERELDTPSDPSYRPLLHLGSCSACTSARRCCETHCSLPTWECIKCVDKTCPECLNECLPLYEGLPGKERELDAYHRRRHIGPQYNRARYLVNRRRRP